MPQNNTALPGPGPGWEEASPAGAPPGGGWEEASPTDFTVKSKAQAGEGLYKMTLDGQSFRDIPYSNVMPASQAGWRVKPDERERYARHRNYELHSKHAPEADFQSMELPEAIPGRPGLWERFGNVVNEKTEPTNYFPGAPTGLFDPATGEMAWNAAKRVGRDLFGIADFGPQAFSALTDALSADPQKAADGESRLLSMHPGTQMENRVKELRDDWKKDPKLAAANVAGDVAGIWLTDKAMEVPGKVMRSEYLTEKVPRGIINRLIKAGTPDLTFGKDPTQAILENGIVGKNMREIGDGVYAKLHEVGQKIDKLANDPAYAGRRVEVGDALKPFDELIKKASEQKPPNVKLYEAAVNARNELYLEYVEAATGSGGATLQPVGPANLRMSPSEALQFKRGVGDRINWNKDPIQGELNQAYGQAYGITKDALNNQLGPDFAKLNKQYSDLVGAAKAVERQVPVEARGATWKLTDIVLGATGHPGIAAVRMAAHHPGVRSRGARFLYNLPGKAPASPPAVMTMPAAGLAAGASRQARKPEKDTGTPTPPPAAASNSQPSAPNGGVELSPLGRAISSKEGFGTADAIPTLANNPGNLELGNIGYGVLTANNGQQITIFGSLPEGRAALEKQLNLIFSGQSKKYSPNMTLEEFGKVYSGGEADYGAAIATSLGVAPSTTLGQLQRPKPAPLPVVKAEAAKKKPSPSVPASAPAAAKKQYAHYAHDKDGHWFGTDDNGGTWFSVETGKPWQQQQGVM
jgi:hypothetical protein